MLVSIHSQSKSIFFKYARGRAEKSADNFLSVVFPHTTKGQILKVKALTLIANWKIRREIIQEHLHLRRLFLDSQNQKTIITRFCLTNMPHVQIRYKPRVVLILKEVQHIWRIQHGHF